MSKRGFDALNVLMTYWTGAILSIPYVVSRQANRYRSAPDNDLKVWYTGMLAVATWPVAVP